MEQIKDDAVFCSQQELQHKYVYIRCYYVKNKQKAEKLVLKGKVSVKYKTLDFHLSTRYFKIRRTHSDMVEVEVPLQ